MKKNKILPPSSGVVIGVPVYNGGLFLREALDDLRRQTFQDFRVVIVDDGSTDNSDEIIKEYLDDPRFHYERLPAHRGKIGAWKRTIKLANRMHHPLYFAYYSDHDRVEPEWLESLLNVLKKDAHCACAYAKTKCIGVDGHVLPGDDTGIHTQNLSAWKRVRGACAFDIGAQHIVYGLFRTKALEKCGWFRDEVFPERLLASEINVYGSIAFVSSAVRFHRLTSFVPGDQKTIVRQKLTLFPPGAKRTAVVSSHATCFLRGLFSSPAQAENEFIQRLVHAVLYFGSCCSQYKSVLAAELENETFSKELEAFKKLIRLGLGGLFSDMADNTSFPLLSKINGLSQSSLVARFPKARFLGPLAMPGFLFLRSAKRFVQKTTPPHPSRRKPIQN